MAVESIGRIVNQEPAQQQASVGLEDFLQIFLAQLNFQDPLEPVDNREFIAQLAQFSSIEIASQSNKNTEGLLEIQSINQVVDLIGKDVNVVGVDGTESGQLAGTVIAMTVDATGNPTLTVKGANDATFVGIRPSQVNIVRDPASTTTP